MDMDPKGPNEENIANNGGQDGAMINNGIQGMQLAQPWQEIEIGSIKIPLTPTGTPSPVQFLDQNLLSPNSLSHVKILMLNDKTGGDSNADCAPGRSTSGLPQVDSSASGWKQQSCRQQGQRASDSVLSPDSNGVSSRERRVGQLVGESADDTRIGAVHLETTAGSAAAAAAGVCVQTPALSTQKICMQVGASGLTPMSARQAKLQFGAEEMGLPGSSAPKIPTLNADSASWPQKILPTVAVDASFHSDAGANHWCNDGQSLGYDDAGMERSSVSATGVALGMEQTSNLHFNLFNSADYDNFVIAGGNIFDTGNIHHPTMPSTLFVAKENEGKESMLQNGDEKQRMVDRNSVGIASPQRFVGNVSSPLQSVPNASSFSLKLMECSTENVPAPTMEEVIACGGIPKPKSGVRSSTRLGC
jgi:hypothetical protein